MEALEPEKPQCGSQSSSEEYDFPLHVAGIFMVLAASIFGAGFPVAAKKIKSLNAPPKVFFACKHFGTGVLVATAFVHLLPTAFGSLSNPCLPNLFTTDYPAMPGVIMMGSMFILFVIEMYLNAKTGGHSHGGPTGTDIAVPAPPRRPRRPDSFRNTQAQDFDIEMDDNVAYEKAMAQNMYEETGKWDGTDSNGSTMPAWFVVFYEQYVRQRAEMIELINSQRHSSPIDIDRKPAIEDTDLYFDEEGQRVDPQVYKKMSANITLLEGGILFHSVFVGMTISITSDGFVILLVAILFHQMFEGLGLGARIAAVPYPKDSIRPWLLVVAFGTTAPIGQAIGLLTRNTYDPESAFGLIIVGIFNAISSGLLIYAALVDLLVEDFLSEEANRVMKKKDKIAAFCWVLLGAIGMSIVGAFA
ncbi:ZIP zinc transporter [Dactylonectria estremocensis]|uniref:ZIP zinc transporter n=1 Tax=Dactylonectria estremocensis TaxID=1079267 RepID=A0A9P9DQG4_9HYPO|nr:ZIP zinc transporter [Dactylonectria estremocensis]